MAEKLILADTSVLIDYYRKTDKSNSVWVTLVRQVHKFAVSAITKYEIYSSAAYDQSDFWNNVLKAIEVIPFGEAAVDTAVDINTALKRKRKQIDLADLFIAATAITHDLSIAALNKKHFDRIDRLSIVE